MKKNYAPNRTAELNTYVEKNVKEKKNIDAKHSKGNTYVCNQIIIPENGNGDISVQGHPVEEKLCTVRTTEYALMHRTVEMPMRVEIATTKLNKNEPEDFRTSTYVHMEPLSKESTNGINTVTGKNKEPEHRKVCTKGYVQQKFS